jgi:arginine utilization protein RocB
MLNVSDIQIISEDILKILAGYMKIPSVTNTDNERLVDEFFNEFISSIDYFKKNTNHYGQYKIKDDNLNRSVNYALLKGEVNETVVLLHHSDIVNIDNYGNHKPFAYDSKKLEASYKEDESFLDEESLEDLNSGQWLFGRGSADMKAGGSIQMALIKHYASFGSKLPNILLIAVPDEENQSLGMRSAIHLLEELKSKHKLDYKLMINSEPHQRIDENKGVISQGSIAKMNVFVHVKGVLAHAGKVLEGLNSNGLMSRIASEIDLNKDFVDVIDSEMSIPPTWVYLRDYKQQNDISFPTSSYGILNVLNFNTTPQSVLNKIKNICEHCFIEYKELINEKRKEFSKTTNRHWKDFDWKTKVLTLSEFLESEKKENKDITKYPEDLENILSMSNYNGPMIIIGLLPPYYPGVTNENQEHLYVQVNKFTQSMWGQNYNNRMYFTGISDLSYSNGQYSTEVINKQMKNMIGWNSIYTIPFESISKSAMPCINVGPWGKDFHRPTERVYIQDLIERTPLIIDNLIKNI